MAAPSFVLNLTLNPSPPGGEGSSALNCTTRKAERPTGRSTPTTISRRLQPLAAGRRAARESGG